MRISSRSPLSSTAYTKAHIIMESTPFQNVTSSHRPLPERVADQITQLIQDRNLSTGDKLPNEFELCELLGVGRGSVREAIKILAARNVVVIERGRGTFVTQHPGQIEDPFGFKFADDQLALAFDLLEVRQTLEPWIAGLAAERATDEDIAKVRDHCLKVEELILAGENHLKEDTLFHIAIAECTHNNVMPRLIPVITYSVGLFGTLNKRTLLSQTIIDHRAVADAIAAHDKDAAIAAMRNHLAANQHSMEQVKAQITTVE